MRLLLISSASTFWLCACATLPSSDGPLASDLAKVPGATTGMIAASEATQTYATQQAQLRDIRNAQARVDLARARLDLATVRNKGAEDGDVREFLTARQDLRRLRGSVYGPTDTGYNEIILYPFGHYDRHWPRRGPRYFDGTVRASDSFTPEAGTATPLSALKR